MGRKNKRTGYTWWKFLIADLLMIGMIILIFGFSHHGMVAIISDFQAKREQEHMLQNVTEPISTQLTVEVPETETHETEPVAESTPEETTPAETEVPDDRTPWQIKFEDHFTDEVVITDSSYTSPEVSITIETVVLGEGDDMITYYVADIYVASIENFKTHTAYGQMKLYYRQNPYHMVSKANAILAITGDSLTYQRSGFTMRNGEIYYDDHGHNSICVLYSDGSMETCNGDEYDIDEIKNKGAIQVWSFGPVLLDENGQVFEEYTASQGVMGVHPRCGVGYYEPGHYCFVVVDGRQWHYSKGMTLAELAQVFEDLGCTAAYNLDGGGTAVMIFDGKACNRQSDRGREAADILLITEAGYGKTEVE